MPDRPPSNPHPFLAGGGELGALIAAFDWHATALGPIAQWATHLKSTVALMLRSNMALVALFGKSGVMIYNDAYSVFAGARHPRLLGSNVREGWPEVADFNDHVMTVGLAGGTLTYRDQLLTLNRRGQAEQVWLDLDYSPVIDDAGTPVGVIAMVVETTSKVRAEQRLHGERERFARLFDQAPTFMSMLSGPEHVIELANPNYLKLVGHRPVLGHTVAEALPDAAAQGYVALLDQVYRSGDALTARGSRYAVQASPEDPITERYVDFVFQAIRDDDGAVSGIFVEGVDVTERMAAEARREALVRLADLFRDLDDPAAIGFAAAQLLGEALNTGRVGYGTIDPDAETLHVERDWHANGAGSLAGVTRLRDYGSFIDSLKRNEFISIDDVRLDPRTAPVAAALEARATRAFVNVPVLEQGRLVAVLFVNDPQPRAWSAADQDFVREIADRTRNAVERARAVASLRLANETLEAKVQERTRDLLEAEERFRQSQKMEAIGQLSGGIAHDFNNLLGGMSASLQVLKKRLAAGQVDGAERYIGMSQEAVRRAAALTQRLLAFSRRQTLDPKPTEINRLIGGLEELIRRTVGPAVSLEVVGAGGLWLSRIDAPQLESAILNLCINARDAMLPNGGRLTIETANKWLDERSASERELKPGQYVSVCVSDTGTGMTPEVIAHAFDPFFTTKPVGQGTGLGLSMVYGFVRQSGGQVRVYSEVGHGTTMCLYLPRYVGDALAEERPEPQAPHVPGGGECVLVVEDEATIRTVLAEELRAIGYQIIAVADGLSALRVLQSDARIDLLLTDVGLPGGLNGRQVADAARVDRPALKVLFLTGYAENAAVGNGLLEPGMDVLTKPFDLEALASRVRELIER